MDLPAERDRTDNEKEFAGEIERLYALVDELEASVTAEEEGDDGRTGHGQWLKENTDMDTAAIDSLSIDTREEVVQEFKRRRRETTNIEIPAAGRTNWEKHEEGDTVEIAVDRSSRTYTEEVPLQGGDIENPDTMTVEYTDTSPSMEDVERFNQEMYRMRAEENHRQQERANRRREERVNGTIPVGYVNLEAMDDIDSDESDIPVAGRSNRE